MADMLEYQSMVQKLGQLGIDPETAALMLDNGMQNPDMMPYIPAEAGLSDDAQRAIAELQNMDQTRNAGNRNRTATSSGPLPWYAGEMHPGGVNGVSIPDDLYFSPRPQEFDPTQYSGPASMPRGGEGQPVVPDWVPRLDLPDDSYELGERVRGGAAEGLGTMTDILTGKPQMAAAGWIADNIPDSVKDFGRGLTGAPPPLPGGLDRPGPPGLGPVPGGLDRPGPPGVTYRPPSDPVTHTAEGGASGSPAREANVELATVDTAETKPNPMNAVQRFAHEKFGWDEDKRSDIGRALLMGGLATMAGTSPDAMENIGRGGLVGAEAYFNAGDERRERGLEEEALAMDREMHELRKQEIQQKLAAGEISIEQATKELEAGIGGLSDFEPMSPTGKLWIDAQRIAAATPGLTAEEVMETWMQQGWYKDPREEEVM